MDSARKLVVVADDLGIGPETTRAILEQAARGVVTGTVLLVNSPFAPQAVELWRSGGCLPDLGWHPCLTLDRPLAPRSAVSSLVDSNGCFFDLNAFLARVLSGRIREQEIETEFRAQLASFRSLTGQWPLLVNTHQHVGVFGPARRALLKVLSEFPFKPYVRRVREHWGTWVRLPGARCKRLALSTLGFRLSRDLDREHYPGAPFLLGLTEPVCLEDDQFFVKWLEKGRGDCLELMCHPGYPDTTLIGRDSPPNDLRLFRRLAENRLLAEPSFFQKCLDLGFRFTRPGDFVAMDSEPGRKILAA